MNTSAKILFTLVAAGALGAVALACTVTSGTVDDTDGGSNTSTSSSSSSSSSSGGTVDGGADTGSSGGLCPELTYTGGLENEACETCLRTSCCAETAACWNLAEKVDSKTGCEDYAQQLGECDTDPDPNQCKTFAKSVLRDGVADGWNTFIGCAKSKCSAQCESEDVLPDAGQ